MPELLEKPTVGSYIHGLYLEGARWFNHCLHESNPGELYQPMPVIWLKPCLKSQLDKINSEEPHYECPIYKTLTRAGALSSTGLSTNFVMTISLPCSKTAHHWIKRGVALICSLDN
jgi:dynein heavy chain